MIYLLPILLILLFIYCFVKKIPAYDHFSKGARSAVDLVISIFPYLVAIFIFVEIMKISGVSNFLISTLTPVLSFLGIPPELAELVILRPFSGSGSLGLLKDIYLTYGVDSYISKCASTIVGASDTLFYVISIYFSTIKINRFRYLLPVALVACFLGSVSACFFVRIFA